MKEGEGDISGGRKGGGEEKKMGHAARAGDLACPEHERRGRNECERVSEVEGR